MRKKITFFGITANLLVIIGFIMSYYYVPNNSIIILAGVLIMMLVEPIIFLKLQNSQSPDTKNLNIIAFISLVLFAPTIFLVFQDFFFIPYFPVLIISVVTGFFLFFYFVIIIIKRKIELKEISILYIVISYVLIIIVTSPLETQQADIHFAPNIENPNYSNNQGPVIFVDNGHNNFHTLNDRLRSTGELFEKDGYKVLSYNDTINIDKLKECKIFMIVNASHKDDKGVLPTLSAFSKSEISNIVKWVNAGGSIFLIADHMPFAGAVSDLAKQFGFEYENGHAVHNYEQATSFYRKTNSISSNIITNGRNKNEQIDSILTFRGSAFKIPNDATSILNLDSSWINYNVNESWAYSEVEPFSLANYSQGAYKTYGKGKVVVFGEAMMFTAQLPLGLSFIKIGMNSPDCPDNHLLLLNIIHWLDGQIK